MENIQKRLNDMKETIDQCRKVVQEIRSSIELEKHKRMIQRGLIIYKKEYEQEIEEDIISQLPKSEADYQIHTRGKGKYKIMQISRENFQYFYNFEDFLDNLAKKYYDLDEKAIVIGHNDESGFIWTDYTG